MMINFNIFIILKLSIIYILINDKMSSLDNIIIVSNFITKHIFKSIIKLINY